MELDIDFDDGPGSDDGQLIISQNILKIGLVAEYSGSSPLAGLSRKLGASKLGSKLQMFKEVSEEEVDFEKDWNFAGSQPDPD